MRSVGCTVENNLADIWVNIAGWGDEKQLILEPGTFILDERGIVWLDLMYSFLPLTTGESIGVPVLYPERLVTSTLNIDVRPSMENIRVDHTDYTVLVCDVGSPTQVHYVTPEGQLVQVVIPADDVTIQYFGRAWLWAYDNNNNETIDFPEMVAALMDYLTLKITYSQMVGVLMCYLSG